MGTNTCRSRLNTVSHELLTLEQRTLRVRLNRKQIFLMMRDIRKRCDDIQHQLARKAKKLGKTLASKPVLESMVIMREAITKFEANHRNSLDNKCKRTVDNILQSLNVLEATINNDDMHTDEAVQILEKLQRAVDRLHDRYIHAMATRESLLVAVNTQGARLDALAHAAERMEDGQGFVRMLNDLIHEFVAIKKILINHEKINTMNLSRQVYALTRRVDRLEALIVKSEQQASMPRHCSETLCHNHGTCSVSHRGFTCSCSHTHVGEFCQYELVPCIEEGMCQNGGNCVQVEGFMRCICPVGWTGTLCQTPTNSCASNPCFFGGTCTEDREGRYKCSCREGVTGSRCELQVHECTSNPCQNNAQCVDLLNGFWCICPPHFTGKHCEHLMNPVACDSSPCLNGGQCVPSTSGHGYLCVCKDNFAGKHCEGKMSALEAIKKAAQCDTKACSNVTTPAPTTSTTRSPHLANPCNSKPCRNNGRCLENPDGTFTCICKRMWGGKTCNKRLKSCTPNSCDKGQVCIEDMDQPEHHRCVKLKVKMKKAKDDKKNKKPKKKKPKKKTKKKPKKKTKPKTKKKFNKIGKAKLQKPDHAKVEGQKVSAELPDSKHRFAMSKVVIALLSGACVLIALLIGALIVCLIERFSDKKPISGLKNSRAYRLLRSGSAGGGKFEGESDIELERLSRRNLAVAQEDGDEVDTSAHVRTPFQNQSNNARPGSPAVVRHAGLLERLRLTLDRRQVPTGSGQSVTYKALPTQCPASARESDSQRDTEDDEF